MRANETGGTALAIAERLANPVRLKTWSLIVTVFGDAVMPRGGSISAHSLGVILGAMGIGSGAVRTAVSRLAADDWIERKREGRVSFYQLSPARQAQFREAEKRIYREGTGDVSGGNWAIISLARESGGERAGNGAMPDGEMLEIARGWYLADLDRLQEPREGMMIFAGRFESCPSWFIDLVAPGEHAAAMNRLVELFEPVRMRLAKGWRPQPLEALALRCLLVHEWRRIVLRLNRLPAELLPGDWPEPACRELVAVVYAALVPAAEEWLSREAGCETGKLPPARLDPPGRFGLKELNAQ